jgi:hypothetical protein
MPLNKSIIREHSLKPQVVQIQSEAQYITIKQRKVKIKQFPTKQKILSTFLSRRSLSSEHHNNKKDGGGKRLIVKPRRLEHNKFRHIQNCTRTTKQ